MDNYIVIYSVDLSLTYLKEITCRLLMEVALMTVAQYANLCFDSFKTLYLT